MTRQQRRHARRNVGTGNYWQKVARVPEKGTDKNHYVRTVPHDVARRLVHGTLSREFIYVK